MAKWHLWLGNAACFAVACGGGATTSPDSSSTDSTFATSTTPSNNNSSIVEPTSSMTGTPAPTSTAPTAALTATSLSTTDNESATSETESVNPQDASSAETGTETTSLGSITSDATTDSGGEESETSADPASNTSDDTSAPDSTDECLHQGTVTYRFNNPESWPADVLSRLTAAMDEATYYYNCYSDLSKSLTINYNPSVPTAEGNVDGVISFGSSLSYMVTATSMHEIAHTLGVGYAPWTELIQDGRWVGQAVNDLMANLPAAERDADMYSQRTYITCDNQHFWPYGLNQANEHQSEWSLINHVRVVAAMDEDKRAARGN